MPEVVPAGQLAQKEVRCTDELVINVLFRHTHGVDVQVVAVLVKLPVADEYELVTGSILVLK